MNTPDFSDGISSEQEQQIAELLSAALDGELTVSEQQQLQQYQQQQPEFCSALQQRLQAAGTVLRSLPVRAHAAAIVGGEELLRAEQKLQRDPPPAEPGRRGVRGQLVAMVVAAALLILTVPRFLNQRQPQMLARLDSSSVADVAAAADALVAEASDGNMSSVEAQQAVAGFGGMQEDVLMAELQSGVAQTSEVASPAPPGAAASGGAAAGETGIGSLSGKNADRQTQLSWLTEADDWRVVVVSVTAASPAELLANVDRVLERHGLQRDEGAIEAESDWIGVVVSGTEEDQQQLITEVEQELGAGDSEWDPAEVMHSSREEIVAAVRRSLVTPTVAELSRGDVFVAVRNSLSAPLMAARNATSPAQRKQKIEPADLGPGQPEPSAAAEQQSESVALQQRPLLIVFSRGTAPVNG